MIDFPSDAVAHREFLREERAARGEPALAEAAEWLVVAFRLESAGYADGARTAYRNVLQLEPRNPKAHFGLARALLDEGAHAEALDSIENASTTDAAAVEHGQEPLLDDPDESVDYLRGLILHALGRYAEAVTAYEACAERFQYFAEVHLERARAHRALGDETAASAACAEARVRASRRPGFREEVEEFLG